MNNEKRTQVIWLDGDGDITNKILLTDAQLRLLNWLREQGYLSDWRTYNILDEEDQPEII